ncbi:MAG TPA: twin-arginine translocase subunit TatC [Acidimicrobiales bacterium]|jgi:sec-independent protein translocase protein TatC
MALRIPFRPKAPRPTPDAMTLVEHIGELRRRLIISVAVLVVTATVGFVVYPQILNFLKSPYCHVAGPKNCLLYANGPLVGLTLRIKIATYGGLFMASPVILWEVWRFITPGLRRNERRYALAFVTASVTLFAAGAVLAYYTFPHALQFLGKIGGPSLKEIYSPENYIGLILALMAVFGLTFEFPVILVSLELVGILQPAKLASWRRWAIVVLVAFSAIITPSGDPFSMMALAIPLYLFYEISIVIGKVLLRRRTPAV